MAKAQRNLAAADELRERAEAVLHTLDPGLDHMPLVEVQRVARELCTRQAELELQNEELRRVQLELEEALDRYAELYDLAPIGCFTLDKDGMIETANLTGATLLGAGRDALLGTPFERYLHDGAADQDTYCLHRRDVIEGGKRSVCEVRLRQGVYARVESSPILDAAGNPVAFRSMVSDISDVRKAEVAQERLQQENRVRTAEIQVAHDRYRLLVETIPYAVQEITLDGTILFANPAHHRIHGCDDGELIGRSVFEFAPTEEDRAQLEAYFEYIAAEQPPPTPWFGSDRTRDGRLIDVRVDWNYKRSSDGRLQGLVAVVTDITEQEQKAAQLRENLNLLETIIESSTDAIYLKDRDSVYRLTNSAGSRLVGRTPDQVVGCTDSEFFPAEIAAYVRANDQRVIEQEQTLTSEDVIETPAGSRVMFTVKSPYRDAEGTVVGLVGVSRDVTERRQAQQALREAHDSLDRRVRERTAQLEEAKRALELDIKAREKAEQERDQLGSTLRQAQTLEAVGRLAGGVAHDFNNLLGSVLGCLHAARQHSGEQPAILEELDRAQQICKRGGELSRQLLTFARRQPGHRETVDVEELFAEVSTLLERTLPKTVRLSVAQEPDLPPIRVDRALFANALLNLALNAKDAMPAGGELSMRAARVAGEGQAAAVSIEVSDTGEGIPPDLQERVFEPFFSTKDAASHHGLGLSTAYATVKEGGGDITVRSRVGVGTTFRIELPPDEAPTTPEPAAQASSHPSHPLTRKLVLVLEDEPNVARMTVDVLRRNGYRTLASDDGLQALEAIRDATDDLGLVILDLIVPGLSGDKIYQVLQMSVPEVPVLLVTGREDLAQDLAPGRPWLAKPFTEDELIRAVSSALYIGVGPSAAG